MGSHGFWRRALANPDRVAAIEPDGTSHTAGDLLARVNQLTHGLRARGLQAGDGVAVLAPNGVAPLEVYLAALQAGWYVTPINWHFTTPEIAHIVRDSEAKAFVVHERFGPAGARAAEEAGVPAGGRISYGDVPGFTPVADVRAGEPTALPEQRTAGAAMHYTSGTTGPPKGVRRPLSGLDPDAAAELGTALPQFFGITTGPPNVHLVTSPHYHTAVTVFGCGAAQMGHCVVYMDSWDAEQALALVERYRVTNTHMVPTQFKRLLALPEEARRRYDLSSMRWLLH
ncbi:MAG TPA: AMP-binding protein, partial [Streptosporangiaceae bacterium]|nr:AMP-binding protein [Streptosporangiaceae bacterium]